MAYDRKDKNKRPNGFMELVEYIKEGISKKGTGRYILYAGIALAAIIVIIVVVNVTGKKDGNDETRLGDVVTIPSDSLVFSTEGIVNPLQKDAYPEINEVIETYYMARLEKDADAINKIVDDESDMTIEKLEQLMAAIEGYENITCYTKKGLLDDTYIVFVEYEVKFKTVNTLAPSLDRYYINKDTEGNPIIFKRSDGEVSAYIEEVSSDTDVAALFADVNKRLVKAKEEDPKLAGLVNFISKPAETTEADSSEDNSSIEETTEAEETTKTETTAAETTKTSTTAAN